MNKFNSTTLEPIKISFDTPIYYVNKKKQQGWMSIVVWY